jgi:hypothetical protein
MAKEVPMPLKMLHHSSIDIANTKDKDGYFYGHLAGMMEMYRHYNGWSGFDCFHSSLYDMAFECDTTIQTLVIAVACISETLAYIASTN